MPASTALQDPRQTTGSRAADRSRARARARVCRGRRSEWSRAHMLRYSDGILIEASAHSLVTTSWQPRREVSSRQGAWSSMSSSSSLAAARLSNSSLCRMQWLHTRQAKHARQVSDALLTATGGQVLRCAPAPAPTACAPAASARARHCTGRAPGGAGELPLAGAFDLDVVFPRHLEHRVPNLQRTGTRGGSLTQPHSWSARRHAQTAALAYTIAY